MSRRPIANLRSKRFKSNSKPSLLEQLGKPLRDFVDDFKTHSADTLKKVREENPEKYLELATKLAALVAALKPEPDGFHTAKSKEDIGAKLLQSIGFTEPDDVSIQAAVQANNAFIAQLEAIRDAAAGAFPITVEDSIQ
jgi:hypothetical protein